MNNYIGIYDDYLAHHGILGMKWGVRRYQNEDGSYTEAGKKRYNTLTSARKKAEQQHKYYSQKSNEYGAKVDTSRVLEKSREEWNDDEERYVLSNLYDEQTIIAIKRLDDLLSYNLEDIRESDIKTAQKYVDHVFSKIEDIDLKDTRTIANNLPKVSNLTRNFL